jgi:phosphoribosylaminoimidazolecarboxamide formyltransferase/IMP cyclohydrolase
MDHRWQERDDPVTSSTIAAGEARRPVRRALLSVSDKSGLAELAADLHSAGVVLVSTGSTAARIAEAGVPVTPVEQVTGFPECLDGRVKTLHPFIHAGLLADPGNPDHERQLTELGIAGFDLLVVNLYPFAATVATGAAPQECVEQIDIGGPAMVRAAAKNHARMAVVVSPDRYATVRDAVQGGGFTRAERQALAAEAFAHTAAYDVAVASWMSSTLVPDDTAFPPFLGATWARQQTLRYGENPHQAAALYVRPGVAGLASARQLHGKEMSYNNYVDADAALRAAFDFAEPAVAVVKHTNPCGIAVAGDIAAAHRRAHATDPVSAFGGVIAANRTVDATMAEQVAAVFTEVLAAPGFDQDAVEILTRKKGIRLLEVEGAPAGGVEWRPISGGLLMQQRDAIDAHGDLPTDWRHVAGPAVDAETEADLAFAWRACRAVKSNAILLAHHRAAVGIGMGQVNRVDSARLAVGRAGDRVAGSVAASDAFFPFPDGLEVLATAGVRAVVQPGGSVRDDEVVAAAERAGVSMFLTGTRHFFH